MRGPLLGRSRSPCGRRDGLSFCKRDLFEFHVHLARLNELGLVCAFFGRRLIGRPPGTGRVYRFWARAKSARLPHPFPR